LLSGVIQTLAKKIPMKDIPMRAVLFGDGAKGMRLQEYANEEFGVYCTRYLKDRDSEWNISWTSDLTGEEIYESYRALRVAYNALLKK